MQQVLQTTVAMKDLKFSILFIVLLMLMGEALGQGTYNEILSTPESTEATKSITRAWKDNAQITYIEDIEYAPFYPDVINSITASLCITTRLKTNTGWQSLTIAFGR